MPGARRDFQKNPPARWPARPSYRSDRFGAVDFATAQFRQPFSGLRSAPENQSEDESHAERGKDRFGRIFANVLFRVVLKGSGAGPGIVPCVFGLAACVRPKLLGFSAGLAPSV